MRPMSMVVLCVGTFLIHAEQFEMLVLRLEFERFVEGSDVMLRQRRCEWHFENEALHFASSRYYS
jgi:hypothetical protein